MQPADRDLDDLIADDAPNWFRRAIAAPFEDHVVDIDGVGIHYVAWGPRGRRGLVFVHGGAAHAHWWTHVAAQFAPEYRVAAVDLAGHGDSGTRRAGFALESFVEDVMAVVADAGLDGPPVIVGHSMGGMISTVTAGLHSEALAGVVVLDSPITAPDPETSSPRSRRSFGRRRIYASREEAIARFRPEPAQKFQLDYVMHYIARMSVRPCAEGWTWKFDPDMFAGVPSMRAMARPYLSRVTCRYALFRSQHGLVDAAIGESMYEELGRRAPVVEIPLAGHHAMLDQPIPLLAALRTLLADWDHSTPAPFGEG